MPDECRPGPGASLPRASFVLLAFNQEEYIQEAIAAALAQDYPNLQIILTDDNSSDQTYEMMQKAAESYAGPHVIRLNRTTGGRGVLNHLYAALQHADGELVVGAAGDDISAPNRVSRLVEAWRDSGAVAIYSAWDRVDAAGKFLNREGIFQQKDRDMAAYFPDREVAITFGATAAYTMSFLRSYRVPETPIWSEDYFLSAIAMLRGEKIAYLDEPLVSYRQHPRAQRNFASTKMDFLLYEQREQEFFAGLADLVDQLIKIAIEESTGTKQAIELNRVRGDLIWYRYRSEWPRVSFVRRLLYTLSLRSTQRLRWAVPRLLGLNPFLRVKKVFRSRSH